MKLLAAPAFNCVVRQTRYGNLLEGPLGFVQSLPNPLPIGCRIAKFSPMRGLHAPAVIEIVIRVVVTLGAGCERRFCGLEICTAVFCVTRDTADSRS